MREEGLKGEIVVEIEVANSHDLIRLDSGIDRSAGVRRLRIPAIVNVGEMMLALPEETIEALGLRDEITDWLHSGYPVANAVRVEAGGRSMDSNCLVLPTGANAVVGQTVIRMMDLVVDEETHTLVPHPESHDGPRMRV